MNTADELKEIFDRIKEAGGDAGYVVSVLSLIWREEFERKEELDSKGKLPKATHFHPGYVLEARRYEKGMPVEIENPHFNLPASVKGKLFEMNVLIINMEDRVKDVLSGVLKIIVNGKESRLSVDGSKLTLRLEQEVVCDNERYIVTLSQTGIEPPIEVDIKRQRGRKGEHQSNMAMYLLYRYFNRLGLKGVYVSIASLVNIFSLHFYCDGKGASLSPENVRKRIQVVKKKKELCEKALDFERNWNKEKLSTAKEAAVPVASSTDSSVATLLRSVSPHLKL